VTAQTYATVVTDRPEKPVVVMVGGFGGIGTEILKRDCELAGARVVVVGRRPNAAAECMDGITAPASVEYIQGWTASTEGALRELLASYATEGARLSRIYHLAGVGQAAGSIFPGATEIADMFAAKLEPLTALARLADEFGGSVVAFSSVNAIVGTVAASVYGAANAAMEQEIAHLRHERGLDAQVIAWSRWSGIGMSRGSDDDEIARSRGFVVMEAEEACRLLAHLRDLEGRTFVAGVEPCSPFMRNVVESPVLPLDQPVVETSKELPSDTAVRLTNELGLTVEPKLEILELGEGVNGSGLSPTEATICEVLKQVVGLNSVVRRDGFFELGVQSLHVPRIISELSSATGRDLVPSDLFEAPNVAALARKIGGAYPAQAAQECAEDQGIQRRKRLSAMRGGAGTDGEQAAQ
jgi:NAD(P)-dependent dehydrogenase (short-subunit alcohol dehydrogenase family)